MLDSATMLLQQQAEIEGYHQQALKDSRWVSQLSKDVTTLEKTVEQQQAEIEALKQQLVTTSSEAKLNYNKGHEDGRKLLPVKELTDEVELLEDELFVKGAIRKSYKEALEQIATGEISNESTNYKDIQIKHQYTVERRTVARN